MYTPHTGTLPHCTALPSAHHPYCIDTTSLCTVNTVQRPPCAHHISIPTGMYDPWNVYNMGQYIYFTGEYLRHRCILYLNTRPLCTIACPLSARVHLFQTYPSSKVPGRASFLLARIRAESCEERRYPVHNFS
jgi:hypothetical protein